MTTTKPEKPEDMGYTLPDGQTFRQVGTEPYEAAGGRMTTLYRLRANCPICGEAFDTTTSRSIIEKREVPRRCRRHRRTDLTVARHRELLDHARRWQAKAAEAAREAVAFPAAAIAHLAPDRRAAILGMFD